MELTHEQKRVLMEVAREPMTATARLMRLSDEWNIEYNVIARAYADVAGSIRPMSPERDAQAMAGRNRPAPPTFSSQQLNNLAVVLEHRTRGVPLDEDPVWQQRSKAAHIKAEIGQVSMLPRNWQLIAARTQMGMSVREVAYMAGVRQVDYKAFEDNRGLPTPDQAARICFIFGLKVEETFIAAAQPQLFTRSMSTLNMLAVLRARRRFSIKELQADVFKATGIPISTMTISAIENQREFKRRDISRDRECKALAEYFGVPVGIITQSVPTAIFALAGQNTKLLNHAIKMATSKILPLEIQLEIQDESGGVLMLEAGGDATVTVMGNTDSTACDPDLA